MSDTDTWNQLSGFFAVWLAFVGLCVGSFLNVVIARVPLGQNISRPRSRCPRCGHTLAWYENVPVLSWLWLRGRCKGCKLPISIRYPLVELLTGFLWVACLHRFGWTYELAPALVLVSLLVPLTFIDLEHWLLPHVLTVPGILAGVALSVPLGPDRVKDAIIGVVAGFLVFRLLEVLGALLFKKEALGAGDKMLLALICAFLTWKVLLGVIFFSMAQGAVVGILLLAFKGRAGPATAPPPAAAPGGPDAAGTPEPGKPLHPLVGRLLWLLGLAEPEPEPGEEAAPEEEWVPGPTSIPLGPWLCLAALELLLLGPWLTQVLPGNLGLVLTGIPPP